MNLGMIALKPGKRLKEIGSTNDNAKRGHTRGGIMGGQTHFSRFRGDRRKDILGE
jgi:hypothetical protein